MIVRPAFCWPGQQPTYFYAYRSEHPSEPWIAGAYSPDVALSMAYEKLEKSMQVTMPVRKDMAFPLTFERKSWMYVLDNKEFVSDEATEHLEHCGFDSLEAHAFKASLRSDYERKNVRFTR